MYINKFNRETDQEKVVQFIKENSFGALINSVNTIPQATHLPFYMEAGSNGDLYLRTHMARANPQWRSISPAEEILVIFQGAHAYISPRWYNHINVPTMNYMAVHVYGSCHIVEDTGLVYRMLESQIRQFEKEHITDYSITTLPENFLKAEMRALVAVEIKVKRIEANFKLSQNRDEENYRNIISGLEKREDAGSTSIAGEMKKILPNFPPSSPIK